MAVTIHFAGMTPTGADCLADELDEVGEHVTVGGTLRKVQRAGDAVSVELCCDEDITVVLGAPQGAPGEATATAVATMAAPRYDMN